MLKMRHDCAQPMLLVGKARTLELWLPPPVQSPAAAGRAPCGRLTRQHFRLPLTAISRAVIVVRFPAVDMMATARPPGRRSAHLRRKRLLTERTALAYKWRKFMRRKRGGRGTWRHQEGAKSNVAAATRRVPGRCLSLMQCVFDPAATGRSAAADRAGAAPRPDVAARFSDGAWSRRDRCR